MEAVDHRTKMSFCTDYQSRPYLRNGRIFAWEDVVNSLGTNNERKPLSEEILYTKSHEGRDSNGNIHQVKKGCLENHSFYSIHHAFRDCCVNPFTTLEHESKDKVQKYSLGRAFKETSVEPNIDNGDFPHATSKKYWKQFTYSSMLRQVVFQIWVISKLFGLGSFFLFFPHSTNSELWIHAVDSSPPLHGM